MDELTFAIIMIIVGIIALYTVDYIFNHKWN